MSNEDLALSDNTVSNFFYHKTPSRVYTVAYKHDRDTNVVLFGISCCRTFSKVSVKINDVEVATSMVRLDTFSKKEGREIALERLNELPAVLPVSEETTKRTIHATIRKSLRQYFYEKRDIL